MKRQYMPWIAGLILISALAGCSRAKVHPISLYKYQPKSSGFEMPAYFGTVEQQHVPIAIIDSCPRRVVDEATREKMLAEVKKSAKKIGADAIHKVRFIKGERSGYVEDPATPFPSLKQGSSERHYLRAEAIKFPDPSRAPVVIGE